MLALLIERSNEIRQSYTVLASELLQGVPKVVLKADARLVATDHDRAFDNQRFPHVHPIPIWNYSA
jgi:hypothetical protein